MRVNPVRPKVLTSGDTTWKVSAPEGGTNPYFFVPERKKSYFESLAEQGFQNNHPSHVIDSFFKGGTGLKVPLFQGDLGESSHFYRDVHTQ